MSSFGRYEILEKLGAGGMAEVYLARAYGVDGFVKDLVLKKVLATRADDTQFRKMFVEEAKITVSLSHTNIVQVFDFGKVDDTYFLAMERVHGSDLRKVLSRLEEQGRRIPLPIALQVVCEVLKGLDYAHRRTTPEGRPLGIVHRDVSPSNILLSYEGEVKLADFGIARAAEKAQPEAEGAGTVIGKPRYMAPEQIRGESVDARADVFGCGVVLVEMLLGEQPFATSNDMDTFAMVLTGTTVKPLDAKSGIPMDLLPIVQRAMATDAGARFSSAAAFLKAIEDYAIDRRIRLSAAPLAELVHSTHPPSMTLTRPDPGPTRDGPTIFERVSAGPGEVAHFTQQDSKVAAVGAVSRVKTARVDVSADVGGRLRRAPWLAAGLITLAVAVAGGWQAGLFGGAEVLATPTPLALVTGTPVATPTVETTATALETPTMVAVRPTATPRRTATPAIVVATPIPVAAKPKGWLKLNSIPWGEVSVNGKPILKTTPIQRLELAPGRYEIEIRNPKTGASGKLSVVIESGKETVHGLELK